MSKLRPAIEALCSCRVCGSALVVDAQPAMHPSIPASLMVTCPNPRCKMVGQTLAAEDYADMSLAPYGISSTEQRS